MLFAWDMLQHMCLVFEFRVYGVWGRGSPPPVEDFIKERNHLYLVIVVFV